MPLIRVRPFGQQSGRQDFDADDDDDDDNDADVDEHSCKKENNTWKKRSN